MLFLAAAKVKLKTAGTKFAGPLLIVGALILGGGYYRQAHEESVHSHQQAQFAACQARYNTAFATQLLERSKISTSLSDAQTRILSDIGKALAAKPTKDPAVVKQRTADFLNLFTEFDSVTAEIANTRTATPLPEIPNC